MLQTGCRARRASQVLPGNIRREGGCTTETGKAGQDKNGWKVQAAAGWRGHVRASGPCHVRHPLASPQGRAFAL